MIRSRKRYWVATGDGQSSLWNVHGYISPPSIYLDPPLVECDSGSRHAKELCVLYMSLCRDVYMYCDVQHSIYS